MLNRIVPSVALLIVVFLAVSVTGLAQQSKKHPRRTPKPVITNPPIQPTDPTDGEAKVVSTADENSEDAQDSSGSSSHSSRTGTTSKQSQKTKNSSEQEDVQRSINSLSTQVERLNDKLTQMQEDDKTSLDMERLTRAEQRAENLRSQLVDVEGKLADLQGKYEDIDYSLKPENIDRAIAGYGTLHPEDLREARRRQLENEKMRVQAQIRILETSKARLETSLVTADAECDRLRRRVEMRDQQQEIEANSKATKTNKSPE